MCWKITYASICLGLLRETLHRKMFIWNTRCSMWSPVIRLRLLGTARFTTEATFSEETDAAGDTRYFKVISAMTGVKFLQWIGSVLLSRFGWFKYCFSSFGTLPTHGISWVDTQNFLMSVPDGDGCFWQPWTPWNILFLWYFLFRRYPFRPPVPTSYIIWYFKYYCRNCNWGEVNFFEA